jgi:hypothetical protein
MMVIVKLAGGFGNQMFQYAAGINLASQLDCECKFDLDWFKSHDAHNGFELDRVFNLNLPIATLKDKKQTFGMYKTFIKLLGDKLLSSRLNFFRPHFLLTEDRFSHILNLKSISNNLYMVGYWQSGKYFSDVEHEIRELFSFKYPVNNSTKYWQNLIQECPNSVSLHVRRGDYISDHKSAAAMGLCTLSYYKGAIKNIQNKIEGSYFFIFSDDLVWARETFDFLPEVYFVDGNKSSDSCLDMYLMSLCSHHILANSSFSWWGAWLSRHNQQVVIAPNPWFNSSVQGDDICPKEWTLLDKNSGVLLSD